MKTVCWISGCVSIIVVILTASSIMRTEPLISSSKAMETAKTQLRFMGYEDYASPAMGLSAETYLAWYNHGRLFGAERVYVTQLSFQPKPGAGHENVEVVEDARTGNIVSVFQYGKPYNMPLF